MRILSLFALVLLLATAAFLAPGFATQDPGGPSYPEHHYDGDKVVRAAIRSQSDLEAMRMVSDDVWSHHEGIGTVEYLVRRERMPDLERLGIPYEILIEDVQRLIERQIRGGDAQGGFFAQYRDLAAIYTHLDGLVAERPDLAQVQTVGTSVEGRPIRAIRITGPGDASSRPQVVYSYLQHAREWITAMAGAFLADRLVHDHGVDPVVTALVDRVEFWIVPITNPDGYVYTWSTDRLWRKNRRNNGAGIFGVDLNRNWDAGWGGQGSSGDPSSDIYRGPAPFSEPESQALRDLMLGLPRLEGYIDIHNFSQLVLQPYGYTIALPPDHDVLDELGGVMNAAMAGVHGKSFVHGPIWTTITPASGNGVDWSYDVLDALAFAFELRDQGEFGFLLPPEQIVPASEESLAGALEHARWIATDLEFRFPEGLPALVDPGAPAIFSVEIVPRDGAVLEAGSARLWWRIAGGGSFHPVDLIAHGGDLFEAMLPTSACGSDLEFWFEATTTTGSSQTAPFAAPAALFTAEVASATTVFEDDFELDRGWTVVNVDLQDGAWQRGFPVNGDRGDPPTDHDGSGRCFVTDNVAGNSDVDGGPTRLVSPSFDLAGAPRTRIDYAYWIFTEDSTDPLEVDVSNDGGQTWVRVASHAGTGGGWFTASFAVEDFVPPTSDTRVRFSVADNPNDSITEAGIDAVRARTIDCEPSGFDLSFSQTSLVRGEPATFVVTGAEPGSRVFFFFTKQGVGAGPCDPFFGGLCFDLLPPIRRFARATADETGVATRTKTVPGGAPLVTFHTQAVDRRGDDGEDSVKSNVNESVPE